MLKSLQKTSLIFCLLKFSVYSAPTKTILQSSTPFIDIAIVWASIIMVLIQLIIWRNQQKEKNIVNFAVFTKESEIYQSDSQFKEKQLNQDPSSDDVSPQVSSKEVTPAIKAIGEQIDEEKKKKKRKRKADRLSDRRNKIDQSASFQD